MGKLSKKLVSIVTTAVMALGITFTTIPAYEAKAVSMVNDSGVAYDDGIESYINQTEATSNSATNYGLTEKTKDGAMLHAFCWSFNTIKNNLKDIAEAGYSTVQTSPANECLAGEGGGMDLWGNGKWYYHYQPTDWKIGNYQLGTRDDFKALCSEAEKYGIKIIVDVLPNHTTPTLNAVSQELKNAAGGQSELYHANGFNPITQWQDRFHCTTGQMNGLPDVNTENRGFQAYYMNFVNDVIACGGDGFRYDTAKHIGVPSDPRDAKSVENDFWPVATGKKAVSGTNVKLNDNGNLFIYGEVLQDKGVPYKEYASYMEMTASGYGGTLRSAVASKDFSVGRIQNWNHETPDKIVTWVESHDTYFNEHESARMSNWDINMSWAIIAARGNGTPLFFNRPDGSNGASGNYFGKNKIGAKGDDNYKAPEVAAVNKFRNAMVGQNEYLRNINGSSQILSIERGNKGQVIINLGGDTQINETTNLASGTYTDQVSGGTFTVSNGKISGTLKGGKITVLYDAKPIVKGASVSSSVASGTFKGESLNVTLSVSGATSGTYKVDGGQATTYTNGQTITLGQNTAVGQSTTLTLSAVGENGETTTTTYTYTKKDGTLKAGLYFTKPSGWGTSIKAYVYDESSGAAKELAAWPGTTMTNEGDGEYFLELPSSWTYTSTKVIFTDGTNKVPSGSLTPGFSYTLGKALVCDGSTAVLKDITVSNPLVSGTVSVSKTAANVGESITIATTDATGGTGTKTYKIEAINSNNVSTVISDYSSTKTATFTPSAAGTYTIKVTVKDGAGATKEASKTVVVSNNAVDLEINSFNVSKASPLTLGNSVTLSASAVGEGTVKYKFTATKSGVEQVIQNYSTSNSVAFTPSTSGTYTLKVTVKDSTGTELSKTIGSYVVQDTVKDLAINTFSASKSSPQNVGTAITISANATGDGTVKYRFVVYDDKKVGTVLRDYSTNNSVSWTPKTAGTYKIYVRATDSTGKVVEKQISNYVIKSNEVSITSFTASVASPQNVGTSIKLSANATGNGAVKYRFVAQSGSDKEVIQDFNSNSTVTWTPKKAGTYILFLRAIDSTGKVVEKQIRDYVVKQSDPIVVTNMTTSVQEPQVGKSVKVTANATSSKGYALTYKFSVHNGIDGWKSLGDFTSANNATFTPSATGTNTVMVEVKDAYGNKTLKMMTFEVKDMVTRIEEDNAKITYTGKWTSYTNSVYSANKKVMYTRDYGSKISFSFTGTGFSILGTKSSDRGYINVTIDNGETIEVDCYGKTTEQIAKLFEKTGLTNGTHTVTIEVTGFQNLSSNDCKIAIDAFDIYNGTIK